ncbi:alpha/beta hydrolase [uncultured Chitinophaga sp.]|jgi:Predicted hydrolase of the alpha/beta superfamily|uniref:alpha/beta hydrolase family protein n=1 Tax=uncultured Chitinophaga sp. TaxID=339340 RepID=UPI0026377A95|nr:alpha/beta hydrolase [uncultured Chitinophaga sp.]
MIKVKYLLAMLLCTCQAGTLCAQETHDISGTWYGIFSNYMGEKQRLLIVLEKNKRGYKGRLESPDNTNVPLPMDSVDYTAGELRFRINEIGLSYKGGWDFANHRFNGFLQQGGRQLPLNISRDEIRKENLYRRPQDPQPPFGYRQEEVIFSGQDADIALAGAFSRPSDSARRYPAVILVSDAGPQDRNEEMVGHKPFAVMADYLTKNGLAVLRYDDRGAGRSSGDYNSATLEDQAADLQAAIAYLRTRKDVDTQQIGLIGHGEGAAIAMMAAAGNRELAFVVSMAGPGLTGRQQQEAQLAQVLQQLKSLEGPNPDSVLRGVMEYARPWFNLLATETDSAVIRAKGAGYLKAMYRRIPNRYVFASEEGFVESSLARNTPYALSAVRFNPADYLPKISCPVLAVNGSMDLQVEAGSNLRLIEEGLLKGGNQRVTARSLEGLNHLFQRCNTCRVEEYSSLDQTIDPVALEFITKWILGVSSL